MEIVKQQVSNLQFSDTVTNYYPDLLTDEALEFLTLLHDRFDNGRLQLLQQRVKQQHQFDLGEFPTFPEETAMTRTSDWSAGYIPNDLQDRRVEITGPVDRKMVINALNSGAKTFMADFEDSNAPTWDNCIQGQRNLLDANRRTISHYDYRKDKSYELNEEIAVLIVRPRGLHLNERHLIINGVEASASLVDFGLYVFHNTELLRRRKSAPYFYLPKLEHYLEARWWDEVFILCWRFGCNV